MHRPLLCLLLLLALAKPGSGVKIGVSKQSTSSTSAPYTTTTEHTIAYTTTPESAAEGTLQTSTDTSTPLQTTTFRSFAVPTFPPKITPTSTSTTSITSATPPTATTIVAPAQATETSVEGDKNKTHTGTSTMRPHCSCDLLPLTCDVNCCCDPDCPAVALNVFDCTAAPKDIDLHNRPEDFQYQHGLPSCKVNDGWLCVFRTNTKPERAEITILNLDTSNSDKWPNLLLAAGAGEAAMQRHSYKYGQTIKLLNTETLDMEELALPFAFKAPRCHIDVPIRYLIPFSSICLVSALNLQENRQKLVRIAEKTRLPAQPRSHQPAAEMSFRLRRCLAADGVCSELDSGDLMANASETDAWENNTYAYEVIVQIMHNYTHILGGIIEFKESEFNASGESGDEIGESTTEYWQRFEVQFLDANSSISPKAEKGDELAVSGSLGYMLGEPVIVAKYVTNSNNSQDAVTPANRVLNYFHANASQARSIHSLRLFSRRNGACHTDLSTTHLIAYGINELKQCTLSLGNDIIVSPGDRGNHTAICVHLQQLAWQQLFPGGLGSDVPLYVSQLGRPQNRSDRWTPLHLSNYDFAPILGQFNAQSFVCHNMLLSVTYEFHIGSEEVDGNPQQSLIYAAVLHFDQRHDLEFARDEAIEVPLSVAVMFYDYATSKGCYGATTGAENELPNRVIFSFVLSIFIFLSSAQ